MTRTSYRLSEHLKVRKMSILLSFFAFLVVFVLSEQTFAQGINYPVANPTGTSGTGNARTDADNLFMRNNIAGLTEIPLNDTEEKEGKLGDSGKGAWRLFGEVQESFYKYERQRKYVGTPGAGINSEASLFAPGAAGEVTYTSGNHKYALGVGLYQVFGFQSKIVDDPKKLGPRSLYFDTRVASNDLAFGGAVRLHKKISVGASFVFGRGFLDLKAPTTDLLLKGIVADSRLDVSDVGAPGFTVGIHIRPTERVSFGFNYKSKREYNLTGQLDTFVQVPVPGGTRIIAVKPDVKVVFKLPQVAEFGFQVHATKKLTVLGDYRFYDYPDALRTAVVQDKASGRPLTSLTVNAKNVHSARFGGIYTINDNTKFNLGCAFTSSGIPDRTLNPGLVNTGGLDLSTAIHKRVYGQWVNFSVAGIFGRERQVYPQINPPFNGVYKGKGLMFSVGVRLRK